MTSRTASAPRPIAATGTAVMAAFVAVVLLAAALAGCPEPSAEADGDSLAGTSAAAPFVLPDSARFAGPRIRAVTLDARREVPPGTLRRLREDGVTTLVVIPFGWMSTGDAPEVRMNRDARWFSEGETGIRALAREADSLGLALVLKPHLWVGDGTWSGHVAMTSEADWRAWEASYTAFADHYARLSAEIGAPFFVAATELGGAARARPAFFRALAARTRTLARAPVTYAANWDEAADLAFWDAYDAIGVNAYYPLADSADAAPSEATLARGWAPHVAALGALSRRVRRPVLVTEVGYRSTPVAAARPWQHERRGASELSDVALQERLYRAFFARVWAQPWCAGAVVWKVYAGDIDAARVASDFTPQGKPAEAVLRIHFRAPDPPRGR